jgi:acyl carrier protein
MSEDIDVQSIENKVIEIISEQMSVDRSEIARQTSFINDLNADSLDAVELVMEFEDEFGMSIPDEEAERMQTVGAVIDFIVAVKSDKIEASVLRGKNMNLLKHLKKFTKEISKGRIEIYNEASIQYELAMYLRKRLAKKYKIQLERNIDYFNLDKTNYLKKEMDIVVFTKDKSKKHCVELKFPTQGQYPEQMFSACKDVKFLEQLVKSGFSNCYFLMFAEENPFWEATNEDPGIYEMFRKEKLIRGEVRKPTGKQYEPLPLLPRFEREYKINWKDLIKKDNLRYFAIEVRP